MVVDGDENPSAVSKDWKIYLNNGRGFDLVAPFIIPSVAGSLPGAGPALVPGVAGALNVAYPGLKSGTHIYSPVSQRSISSVDAAFTDVNGDGVADIAQRVWHDQYTDSGQTLYRSGIAYWSRAGLAPQDLLVAEQRPLNGSRTVISYLSTTQFQWPNGVPDGNPPPGGHRPAIGMTAYMVRSVTVEPYLGRPTQKTSVSYDYKEPFYDLVDQAFTGFARITVTPLDPSTGASIPSSTSSTMLFPQRPNARGGQTQVRIIDNVTGAPISESLTSYAEALTAGNGPGPAIAYFSAPSHNIQVEFPHDIARGAVLDFGFDGHRPLDNRTDSTMPPASSSTALVFDAKLPTGGAITLSPTQWVELDSSYSAVNLGQLSLEAWVKPDGGATRGIIAQHPDGYELAVDALSAVTFKVKLAGAWSSPVNGGALPSGRWSHVVASYDGVDLRIFVDGIQKAIVKSPGTLSYPTMPSGGLRIGCAWNATTGQNVDCFTGSLGELRIYPEAWKSPARITMVETEYQMDSTKPNFGMPIKTWDYGHTATPDDDAYEEITYAVPVTGSTIQNAVSTHVRRAFTVGPTGNALGGYLGYSETLYDSSSSGLPLPLGEVQFGNPRRNGVYSGAINSTTAPVANTFTSQNYTEPLCPGVATETIDPLGAVTQSEFDPTCSFLLKVVNALGHTVNYEYFGVDGKPYKHDFTAQGQLTTFSGLYGQVKLVIDANGVQVYTDYDEWGRVSATMGPYDKPTRPITKTEYTDPTCFDDLFLVVACEGQPNIVKLASPAKVTTYTWDDTQHDYRISHTFGDGQVHTEVVNEGENDWLISGTQDYDALGRVITVYKPRYLPTLTTTTIDACPPAGTWCDSANLQGDPLRAQMTVAHMQTAYDSRGRVIRTYGPDTPACSDPSAHDTAGNLLCDAIALGATPQGHFTQFEYPAPGVVRTIDAQGVPSVTRLDVWGRTQRVEEYQKASPLPYATSEYTYDRNGNATTVKDTDGNTTTAIYDALGRKISGTDPDMGTWRYHYTKNSQIELQETASGAQIKSYYDILGRLIRQEHYLPPTVASTCLEVVSRPPAIHGIPEYEWIGWWPIAGPPGPPPLDHPYPYGSFATMAEGFNPWVFGAKFTNFENFASVPFMWDEVTFTPLPLEAGDPDNGIAVLDLPFDFALSPTRIIAPNDEERLIATDIPDDQLLRAGTPIYINTNGRILFGSQTSIKDELEISENTGLSYVDQPLLAPFWDDLEMTEGISYALVGEEPDRELTIQWNGIYKSDPESSVLFRAILIEGTYEVQFQYHTLSRGSRSATIGLQSHNVDRKEPIEYSFNNSRVRSGQSLTTMHQVGNNVVEFDIDAVRDDQRVSGMFAFAVDLTNETAAELSFKHSWDSQCTDFPQGACTVDNMSVLYSIVDEPGWFSLLSMADLTMPNAFQSGLVSMIDAPIVSATFPPSLLGKKVNVAFFYDSIIAQGVLDIQPWKVDDVKVCSQTTRVLEDVVEWRYDSAEPMFTYDKAKPVLDLTFDVPGMVVDRSSPPKQVTATAMDTGAGVSGHALVVVAGTHLEVPSAALKPFAGSLTVETWVNPSSVSATQDQYLVSKTGSFALIRNPSSEHLQCQVDVGLGLQGATSTGTIPMDTWTHVAMTYDGSKVQCYINGQPDGLPQPITGNLGWNPNQPLYIGWVGTPNSYYFNGLIDELRVFSTARLPDQIIDSARAPHQHGPPRGNALDLRFDPQQNWSLDASGAENNADKTNPPTLLPGVEGTSVSFNGSAGQYVMVPDALSLQSQSNQLTAEVWLKTSDVGDRLLVGKWNATDPGWQLALQQDTGRIRFEVRTSVSSPDTWSTWSGDTSGLATKGNVGCPSSANSPTAEKDWVAPATGYFTINSVSAGATFLRPVIFLRDKSSKVYGCVSSSFQIHALQGETFKVVQSGISGSAGPFTINVTGPNTTSTAFVTVETVNDGKWHHIAGVYDSESLKVYIDGEPAHWLCREPDIIDPETGAVTQGAEIPCDEKVPEEQCTVNFGLADDRLLPEVICAVGSIVNTLPIYIGNYDQGVPIFQGHPSLNGMEDEIRISNYAKPDFEVAASARLYSAYTSVLGRLVEMRNRTTTENYSYDLLGSVASVQKTTTLPATGTTPTHNGQYLTRTAFDSLGRTSSLRYPDGEVVVSNYDRGGTEVSLVGYGNFVGNDPLDPYGQQGAFGQQPYLYQANTTSTGRIRHLLFGNRVETLFTYDEGPTVIAGTPNTNGTFGNELLSSQITTLPGGVMQHQLYEYDEVGNLEKRVDSPSASTLHLSSITNIYDYDDLSRLESFETKFGTLPSTTVSYDYDPLGNLTDKENMTLDYGTSVAMSNCGRTAKTTLPHAVTRMTQGTVVTQYCYDANGALAETRIGGTTEAKYTHNVRGKMSQMTNSTGAFTFRYDGNGERIYKVEPAGVTTEPFAYYRVTPSDTEKYYFAGGLRIARRTGPISTDVSWYHPEHLGSTNFMTDAAGEELQEAYSEYTPFGTALPNAANNGGLTPPNGYGNTNTPVAALDTSGGFQFTEKELDDTGLYYYGARYYDPAIGRFIEPDSIVPSLSPQAMNRYSYVLNNPIKYIDPSGLVPEGLTSDICQHCSFNLPELEFLMSPLELAWILAPMGIKPSLDPLPIGYQNEPYEYSGAEISVWRQMDPNRGIPNLDTLYGGIQDALVCSLGGPEACIMLNAVRIQDLYNEGTYFLEQGQTDQAAVSFGLVTLSLVESAKGKGPHSHGAAYKRANRSFKLWTPMDAKAPRHIRGWIRQEINRVGPGGYLRNPPGYDTGHIIPGIDEAWNLRWETGNMNRSRGGKYQR